MIKRITSYDELDKLIPFIIKFHETTELDKWKHVSAVIGYLSLNLSNDNMGTWLAYLQHNPDHSFSAMLDSTALGTTRPFPADQPLIIDINYDPDPEDGVFQVKINNELVINYVGQTTPNGDYRDLNGVR